jgi:hypothetical protein
MTPILIFFSWACATTHGTSNNNATMPVPEKPVSLLMGIAGRPRNLRSTATSGARSGATGYPTAFT